MTIPSYETLAAGLCEDERGEGDGTLVGEVRSHGTGSPIPAARVQVTWETPPSGTRESSLLDRPDVYSFGDRLGVETATNPAGWYTACGVPSDLDLEVVAEFLDRGTDTLFARLAVGDSRRLDFELGVPAPWLTTVTLADGVTAGEGTQGVQGRVRDKETDQPVPTAEVFLRAPGGRILASGITNERGFFRLLTRVPGAYTLGVEALGYEEGDFENLRVEGGRLSVVDVSLPPQALELEPLVVVGEPRVYHLEMEGFYERRQLSGGFFFTPEMIDARHTQRTTQLFLEVPGATVVQDQMGQNAIQFKTAVALQTTVGAASSIARPTDAGGQASPCWPRVYLDGVLMHQGGYGVPAFIDGLSKPMELAGIEVYRSPAEIPIQFGGPNSRCGVIVMWNKRGGGVVGGEYAVSPNQGR